MKRQDMPGEISVWEGIFDVVGAIPPMIKPRDSEGLMKRSMILDSFLTTEGSEAAGFNFSIIRVQEIQAAP